MSRLPPELCGRCANVEGCPLRAQFYEDAREPGARVTACEEFTDVADVVGEIFTLAELEAGC